MKPFVFVLVMCLALVGLAAVGQARASDQVDISLRAPVGAEMRFTVECREFTTNLTPGEPATRRGTEHAFGLVVKVVRRDASGAGAAAVSLEWYAVGATSSAGRRHGFDSRNPNAEEVSAPLAKEIQPLLNVPVVVEFDPGGGVLVVSGVDALAQTQLTARVTTELFSLEAMQRKVGPMLGVGRVPPQAAIGDTWWSTDSIALSHRFSMDVRARRSLARHSGGRAVIEDVGEISIPAVGADAPVIASLDNGSGGSTIIWNTKDGTLEKVDAFNRLKVVVTTGDQQRTVDIELQETIRRVK